MVQSGREQLRHRDHSMLPSRQSGDHNVGCGGFMGIIAIAINTPHPVYVGALERPKGTPPPLHPQCAVRHKPRPGLSHTHERSDHQLDLHLDIRAGLGLIRRDMLRSVPRRAEAAA